MPPVKRILAPAVPDLECRCVARQALSLVLARLPPESEMEQSVEFSEQPTGFTRLWRRGIRRVGLPTSPTWCTRRCGDGSQGRLAGPMIGLDRMPCRSRSPRAARCATRPCPAIGVTCCGRRPLPGLGIQQFEGTMFWLNVAKDPRKRGAKPRHASAKPRFWHPSLQIQNGPTWS